MANKTIPELRELTALDAQVSDIFVVEDVSLSETKKMKFDEYFTFAVNNLVTAGDGFSKTQNSDGTFTFAGTVQTSLSQTLATANNWISQDGSKAGISFSAANALAISPSSKNYGIGGESSGYSHVVGMALTTWGKSYFSDTLKIGTISSGNALYIAGNTTGYEHPLVVDYRGRLGINNSSPSEFLDVDGNALINGTLIVEGNIATSSGRVYGVHWSDVSNTPTTLEGLGITSEDPLLSIGNNSDLVGPITISASSSYPSLSIAQSGSGYAFEYPYGSFVITKEGYVGIRNTSPTEALYVDGNLVVTGTISGTIDNTNTKDEVNVNITAIDSSHYLMLSRYTSGYVEPKTASQLTFNPYTDTLTTYQLRATNVTATGTLNADTIVETSDRRIKDHVTKIDNAIEKVTKLSGYTFFKNNSTKRSAGVIAQEVAEVFPEVVHEGEDGTLNVSYGNMVGLLIEAIKEQQIEIESLKKLL